jgi:hypothetical protein
MATLYAILLPAHSILRWLVLLAALFAIIRALTGLRFKRPWENMDDKAGLWFVILFDIQVLIGLTLSFFLSPVTLSMWQNMGGAMSNPTMRYFGVEHAIMMIIALALAHVGRARSKKATDRRAKHRAALIFFALSLAVTIAAIPWPFLSVGRSLFPGL